MEDLPGMLSLHFGNWSVVVQTTKPTAQLIRWVLHLQGFTFTVKYWKGKSNTSSDALSRTPTRNHSSLPVCAVIKSASSRPQTSMHSRGTNLPSPTSKCDGGWLSKHKFKHIFDLNEEPSLPWSHHTAQGLISILHKCKLQDQASGIFSSGPLFQPSVWEVLW